VIPSLVDSVKLEKELRKTQSGLSRSVEQDSVKAQDVWFPTDDTATGYRTAAASGRCFYNTATG
jgi:hypothetical protein